MRIDPEVFTLNRFLKSTAMLPGRRSMSVEYLASTTSVAPQPNYPCNSFSIVATKPLTASTLFWNA